MQLLKQYWLGLVAFILIVIAGYFIYQKLHPKTLPSNLVEGVGRIDGDLVNLNVKYPGRVKSLTVHDGMPIGKGQVVAVLSSDEQEAKLSQIRAEVAAKTKELHAKEMEVSIAKKTIPLALKRAKAQLEARHAALKGIDKEIEALEKVVAQEKRDYERTRNLYAKMLVQKELLEKAALKYRTDADRLQGLREKRREATTAIEAAEADLEEAKAQQRKIAALEASLAALAEEVNAVRAAESEIEAVLKEMTVTSPIDGFVVEKIAEEGEVLGAGMPVATLIDPATLYLKIFIDTINNGKIKLHDKAVIFLDAYPDRPIEAEVVRIAQKAEFTPKEVNVRSDRIQRVFAVHLKPLKPDPLLKLGLPAIGVVSLDGKGLPESLNEIPEI